MKTVRRITVMCLMIVGFLGCSTPPEATPQPGQLQDLFYRASGSDLQIPDNYRSQFAFRQPTVLVSLSKVEMKEGQVPKGLDMKLVRALETKLYGLKRFDIWLTQSDAFKKAVESGLIDPPPAKDPPKIDLLFDCKLMLTKQKYRMANGK